jgi:hypothetical protein
MHINSGTTSPISTYRYDTTPSTMPFDLASTKQGATAFCKLALSERTDFNHRPRLLADLSSLLGAVRSCLSDLSQFKTLRFRVDIPYEMPHAIYAEIVKEARKFMVESLRSWEKLTRCDWVEAGIHISYTKEDGAIRQHVCRVGTDGEDSEWEDGTDGEKSEWGDDTDGEESEWGDDMDKA